MAEPSEAFVAERLENAVVDAQADLVLLDMILETAVPDEDASAEMGLPHTPGLHRVVMTNEVQRALLRAVQHVRNSVSRIDTQLKAGGYAAMHRGRERPDPDAMLDHLGGAAMQRGVERPAA